MTAVLPTLARTALLCDRAAGKEVGLSQKHGYPLMPSAREFPHSGTEHLTFQPLWKL